MLDWQVCVLVWMGCEGRLLWRVWVCVVGVLLRMFAGCELDVLMLVDSYGSFVCGYNACGVVAWVVFWLDVFGWVC